MLLLVSSLVSQPVMPLLQSPSLTAETLIRLEGLRTFKMKTGFRAWVSVAVFFAASITAVVVRNGSKMNPSAQNQDEELGQRV